MFNGVVTWKNNRHYVIYYAFLNSIKFIFFNWLLLVRKYTLLLGRPSYDIHSSRTALCYNNRSSAPPPLFLIIVINRPESHDFAATLLLLHRLYCHVQQRTRIQGGWKLFRRSQSIFVKSTTIWKLLTSNLSNFIFTSSFYFFVEQYNTYCPPFTLAICIHVCCLKEHQVVF